MQTHGEGNMNMVIIRDGEWMASRGGGPVLLLSFNNEKIHLLIARDDIMSLQKHTFTH